MRTREFYGQSFFAAFTSRDVFSKYVPRSKPKERAKLSLKYHDKNVFHAYASVFSLPYLYILFMLHRISLYFAPEKFTPIYGGGQRYQFRTAMSEEYCAVTETHIVIQYRTDIEMQFAI